MQKLLNENAGKVSEARPMLFRMGVNLGDIIEELGDIHGDGVNIAARLEGIAAPGGICVSSAVLKQVRRQLHLETEDLGERALKNIEDPVHAYEILHVGTVTEPSARKKSESDGTDGFLTLPQRVAIAILPFRNLNGDAENDYIADGIGLGIQTLMVQLSGLFLINASYDQEYQEGRKSAAEVVKELPVRYALEGTVQRAGLRVRVQVQLFDKHDGSVIWAERFDRELEDIFALQDDVTRVVISSLSIELLHGEYGRISIQALGGDGAWEYFLRGVSHLYKFNKIDNRQAQQMFEKLYTLRPDNVLGPGYLALSYWLDAERGWAEKPVSALSQATEWAAKAMEYEDNNGLGHVIMSDIRLNEGKHEEALTLSQKGVEFRTSCPAALGQAAKVQIYCGDSRRAVRSARNALSVRTLHPPMIINLLATAYRDNGDIGLSISAAREAARRDPELTGALATLCCDYVMSGDAEKAKSMAENIMSISPEFRVADYIVNQPYKDRSRLDDLVEMLRSAGLPG